MLDVQLLRLEAPEALLVKLIGQLGVIEVGDLDRALASLEQAVRLDPSAVVAVSSRGATYGMKGDLDRAIADLDQSVKLSPDDPRVFHNRAIAWRNNRKYVVLLT